MKFIIFATAALAQSNNFHGLRTIVGKDSQQCHDDHSTEADCNKDDECAWCHCAAVPSGCFSVEDAGSLPYPAFDCDKKTKADPGDECFNEDMQTEDKCKGDSSCVFCKVDPFMKLAGLSDSCIPPRDVKDLTAIGYTC